MLTGDTSRPPPLRYLRTCAKVDNTNATTGLLAPKIRAVRAATRSPCLLLLFPVPCRFLFVARYKTR